jgi:pimeloyl-ACP methyl ester carboxylesterase
MSDPAPRRPEPAHEDSGTISSDGVELYYEVTGAGEPLLMVAGLADDHLSWGPVTAPLAETHRVITFDNRGVGASSTPPGPYSIAQMAQDAYALIEQLGLAPLDVLGSSMGGAIALTLASHHPDSVRRLVLTNTWLAREPYLELLFDHWRALAVEGNAQRLTETGALFAFSPGFLLTNEERIEELVGGAPPLEGYAASAHACGRFDGTGIAGSVRQPSLVIGGKQDMLTRPRQSELLAEALPDSRLAWLDAGHMTFWEQPDAFVAVVREFLDAG